MLMILMTGLSGTGKSTLAMSLQEALSERNIVAEVIDAEVYRKTINKDLGFSESDRRENIRRLSSIAFEKKQMGIIAIVAAINPFEDLRSELSQKYGAKVIWISCNIEELIKRDTKGLYRKALLPAHHPDKLWNLTGINDRYDVPLHADLVIDTTKQDIEFSVEQLLRYVLANINA